MKINIIPIGNSKGFRLPKAILEQCRFDRCAELLVVKDHLVIKPYPSKAREGWDKLFTQMHQHKDDQLIIKDNLDLNTSDWVW